MTFTWLFIIAGLVLILMALGDSVLKRLPLTSAIVYVAVGYLMGSHGAGLLHTDIVRHAVPLERLTEVAVIVSLFTAGLSLRIEWRDPLWRLPLRLATLSMFATIAAIAAVGVALLDLSLGAAILLGAILAPTDPVLASEVTVDNPLDRDRLRFSLTGEAGLNDGSAFPFVMLGLGLLHHHHLGAFGWRWVGVDLLWAAVAGIAIGILLGTVLGHAVLHLRRTYRQASGLDDFLALGLIALAYGAALLVHAYGFLAVFAAGLALRRIEHRATGERTDEVRAALEERAEEAAFLPETAPAHMARSLLGVNERLERIGAVAVVIVVGTLLSPGILHGDALWFVPLLLLVIRPAAVGLGLLHTHTPALQRRLIAWFGIRGIGSLYYLTYAIVHGLEEETARRIADLALATIAVSVVVHGISVTPLMARYERRRAASRRLAAPP
jgi:NhaP-type Na+/H+ or K+/H+ antiporter